MDGKNVLSLVVEIDCARFLGEAGLVGVVAETLTRGKLKVRIERVGRPEVKNMMLAPKQFDQVNRDLEIRDLYNMEDGFQLAEGYQGAYRARLNANLAFWDGLDGKTDWPLGATAHPLTELVLADYLVVDPGKPYAEQGSFLEIELAARDGRAHQTCGGRALNDDVMDTDLHAADQRRQRPGDPRRRRPVDESRLGQLPVPRACESGPARAARAPPLMAMPRARRPGGGRRASSSTTSRAARCTSGPRRMSGSYLLLRIDDRAADGSWCGVCTRSSTPAGRSADPAHDAWITVAFTYHGLEALGVPQDSLDSFAPEFRQGMAARAAELGDVGESSPEHWEKPLGTADVHVAIAVLSPDAAGLEALAERAREAHEQLPASR